MNAHIRRTPVLLLGLVLLITSVASSQTQSTAQQDIYRDPLPEGALIRLGSTRWRHGGSGQALAFTLDGQFLVSGGVGGVLKLWDPQSGRVVQRIQTKETTILAIAFSPDGLNVAGAGADGRVCIHELATGKEIRNYLATVKAIYGLAYSADGVLLAVAGHEGVISVIDLQKNKQIRLLTGHEKVITALAFAPDGKAIVSSSQDQTVRFWDIASGKEVARIQNEQYEYPNLALAPDGKLLAVGCTRGDGDPSSDRVRLWDLGDYFHRLQARPDAKAIKRLVKDLDAKNYTVRTQATKELGQLGTLAEPALREGLNDKPPLEMRKRIEDLLERLKQGPALPGEIRQTLPAEGLGLSANGVAFTPKGDTLAIAETAGIRLWDVKAAKEIQLVPSLHEGIVTLAFHPNSKSLAYTDGTSLLAIATRSGLGLEHRWQSATLKDAAAQGPVTPTESLAFAPDGKTLASCSTKDKTVRLWDSTSGKELQRLPSPCSSLTALVFAADGKTLAVGGDSGDGIAICVWETGKYQELRTVSQPGRNWMFGVRFSPEGRYAAAVRWSDDETDGVIQRWDLVTGAAIGNGMPWPDIRSAPALFPEGRSVAVGDAKRAILVRATLPDRELHRLTGHKDEVGKVIVSPNGKLLASNGNWARADRKDVRIWDVTAGREHQVLDLPNDCALALAFAPDSTKLATGGADGIIRIWDTATGKVVQRFQSPTQVDCLAFAPDGKRLASGGVDTAVMIWGLQ